MAKLYYRHGPMNSGKSIEIIRAVHSYESQGMKTLVLNHKSDLRFSKTPSVASRTGISTPAIGFDEHSSMLETFKEATPQKGALKCVFVDEAQFLTTKQVDELARIVTEMDVPVICYGLRTDFQGHLFEWSKRLFELAQSIDEIKTVCWCTKKATMNARVVEGKMVEKGEVFQIGAAEYVPLCLEHYLAKSPRP